MARRLMYGSDAVAAVVLTSLFDDIVNDLDDGTGLSGRVIAAEVLSVATVEHRPNARKLILTFDLGEEAPAGAVPDQQDA